MSPTPYKLILGLGNPRTEYHNTYHNAGALAVAWLAKHNPRASSLLHQDFGEQAGNKTIFAHLKGKHFSFAKGKDYVLAVPTTFMNESGIAAHEALKFFKLKPEELCVIHDDSDIELGKYKVSVGRGSAGHHGVDSIVGALKTNAFTRIRIGIRPKINLDLRLRGDDKKNCGNDIKRKKASEFVLAHISKKNLTELYGVFAEIKENVIEKLTPPSPATKSVSGKLIS